MIRCRKKICRNQLLILQGKSGMQLFIYVYRFQSFQDDLEAQQQKVNSLTHMVVVVDDNANDNATAELEEQLGILGERWSSVCKWTEERQPNILMLLNGIFRLCNADNFGYTFSVHSLLIFLLLCQLQMGVTSSSPSQLAAIFDRGSSFERMADFKRERN